MPTPRYGQPRYRAIAAELQRRIETGAIPPGALLPPESTLTTEIKASRGTIRQAIATLRENGLVATEHGRGTYAAQQEFLRQYPTSSEADIQESEIPAPEDLATILNIPPGTILRVRQSVVHEHNMPVSVTRVYQVSRGFAATQQKKPTV